MTRIFTSILLCVTILLSGCTERQGYATLQNTGRVDARCEAMQNRDDAARCEADFSQTYDQYQRERQEVLRQQQ